MVTKYRSHLPQLSERLFLTDGGIETSLIFHEGLSLPDFAAFDLLKTADGTAALRKYFRTYAEIAKRFGTGLILESATWRASGDWGTRLGYSAQALADSNRQAIRLLEEIRDEYETGESPIVISGCIGPRGDGYVPNSAMSETDAERYHRDQVQAFAGTAADMISAITMNYVAEAVGIVRAARAADMPVAISFTVETDGRLPTGESLRSAIEEVDAKTGRYAAYYAINCAHPTHFEDAVAETGDWIERIRAVRANASRRSHAELNDSPELDIGSPAELGGDYARLMSHLPRLNVMGGCCGTDHRHITCIAKACLPLFQGT
ncbi:MAG TPA: homocysteine S-methyltransferase family protein [Vicinamibacterales bacterium]|nr:homocysteine S-methyltransferase family protein [Vicinamibacterales bacterium]